MGQKENRAFVSVFFAVGVLLSASTAAVAAPQQKVCYTSGTVVCGSDRRVIHYTEVGRILLNPEWDYYSVDKVQSFDPTVPFAHYKIPGEVQQSLAPAILAAIKKGTPDPYNHLTEGNVNRECYETREGAEANRARRMRNHLDYYRGNDFRNCKGNNGAEAIEVAGAWDKDPAMPKDMMVATAVQGKSGSGAGDDKAGKKPATLSPTAKPAKADDRTPSGAVLTKQEERRQPVVPTGTEPEATHAPGKDYDSFQSYVSEAAAKKLAQQYIDQGKLKPYGPVMCKKTKTPTGAYGKYLYTCSVRVTPEPAPAKPAGPASGATVSK